MMIPCTTYTRNVLAGVTLTKSINELGRVSASARAKKGIYRVTLLTRNPFGAYTFPWSKKLMYTRMGAGRPS